MQILASKEDSFSDKGKTVGLLVSSPRLIHCARSIYEVPVLEMGPAFACLINLIHLVHENVILDLQRKSMRN